IGAAVPRDAPVAAGALPPPAAARHPPRRGRGAALSPNVTHRVPHGQAEAPPAAAPGAGENLWMGPVERGKVVCLPAPAPFAAGGPPARRPHGSAAAPVRVPRRRADRVRGRALGRRRDRPAAIAAGPRGPARLCVALTRAVSSLTVLHRDDLPAELAG